MRLDKNNQWSTQRASWKDLTSRWVSVTEGLEPRQLRAVKQICSAAGFPHGPTAPKDIDLRESKLAVGQAMRDAIEAGVSIIGPEGLKVECLRTPPEYALVLKDVGTQGICLLPALRINGTEVLAEECMFLGADPWAVWVPTQAVLVLLNTHETLGLTSRLFIEGKDIKIPSHEAFEFWMDYAPALEQLVPIVGRNGEHAAKPNLENPLYAQLHLSIKNISEGGAPKEPEGTMDWFDIHASIRLGSEVLGFEAVQEALDSGEMWLRMPTGQWVDISGEEYVTMSSLLAEAKDRGNASSDDGHFRLGVSHIGVIQEILELGHNVDSDGAWEKLKQRMQEPGIAVVAPVGTTLRDYQLHGVKWLLSRVRLGLGAILADDMGLGKTLQVLTVVRSLKKAGMLGGAVLVVAPTSVAEVWSEESARFAPDLRVKRVSSRDSVFDASETDVVLTTYGLLRLDAPRYAQIPWAGLVFDEAQNLKNADTLGHKAALKLPREWAICATGTPIENSISDLSSLMRLALPSALGSQRELVLDESTKARVAPFILRRKKAQVASELPEKTEQEILIDLHPEHRKVYEEYLQVQRLRLSGLLEDYGVNRIAILAALTKLRMLALSTRFATPSLDTASAKLDYLVTTVADLVRQGHHVLVFSQFTSFLELIREGIRGQGVPHAYLDGSTRNRAQVIESFKESPSAAFLISLRAGGVGLNLTEADYVFIADPWWNPAVEEQAVDRAHRIGQDKKVSVYRLVSKNTIEEKVMALKDKKRQLINAVLDEELMGATDISAQDIRNLLL
ncbi:MAG: DEAD/DEAH box helicase [Actinomycetaceae bacterium]|nr:DEAD/DEAH box helicase [Actinomycetaceae bacterium]